MKNVFITALLSEAILSQETFRLSSIIVVHNKIIARGKNISYKDRKINGSIHAEMNVLQQVAARFRVSHCLRWLLRSNNRYLRLEKKFPKLTMYTCRIVKNNEIKNSTICEECLRWVTAMRQIGFNIRIIHSNDQGQFVEFNGHHQKYNFFNTWW